jgi:hypothetical protein
MVPEQLPEERAFVHLAYLDETGTDGHSPIVMYGALIVPVGRFGPLSALHSVAIQQIIPLDRMDDFTEFHAYEIYKGTGVFEGIDETKRFAAINVLLSAVRMDELRFIYAAADRKKFASSPFGSGKPLISAFHMCLLGVEDWATANHPQRPEAKRIDWNDTCLYVVDDCDNKELKTQLRNTYHTLRVKHPMVPPFENRLWHAHDDMFFANSKDCLGIQIVDLCNYFVRMHLAGEVEPHNFYELFSGQISCAQPEPEWTQFGHMFRAHDPVAADASVKELIDGK